MLLGTAMAIGLVWGCAVAVWFHEPLVNGLRLGLVLFAPGTLLAARPLDRSAVTAVIEPDGDVPARLRSRSR
jgi:hypothetical protein